MSGAPLYANPDDSLGHIRVNKSTQETRDWGKPRMSIFDSMKAPQHVNDFAIRVADKDWGQRWIDLMSAQTKRVEVNLFRKEVTIHVRQLKAGVIQDVIFHTLAKDPDHRTIDEVRVRPARKQAYEYIFKVGHVVDHFCAFDYEQRDVLVHQITLKFEEVELKTISHNVGAIKLSNA